MLIIDGHLDLAWNALAYDREQTLSIAQLRQREASMTDPGRAHATNCLPEMQQASVAICLATLLARARPRLLRTQSPDRTDIDHASDHIASAIAHGQLAYYQLLQRRGHLSIIRTAGDLNQTWTRWLDHTADRPTLGSILLMEGADPILDPTDIQHWWDQGLRALSLAHYGPGTYAYGTPTTHPIEPITGLTPRGRQFLTSLNKTKIMLDLTHSSDPAFFEAYDLFTGPVFASHSNCRALVPGPRQLSNEQIKKIVERDGVIGIAMENSMLLPQWRPADNPRDAVTLQTVSHHIDHLCQLAGNSSHAVIGSDLDGGFGNDRCPRDLDTISDLQKLEPILASRGYKTPDIKAIFHDNWLRFLRRNLPEN
jgi:membrane dipeptidase